MVLKRAWVVLGCALVITASCRSTTGESVTEVTRCTFFSGGEVPIESTVAIRSDGSLELLNPGEKPRSASLTQSELDPLLSAFFALRGAVSGGDISCAKPAPHVDEDPAVIIVFNGAHCEYSWYGVPSVVRSFALRLGGLSKTHFKRRFYVPPSSWPTSF